MESNQNRNPKAELQMWGHATEAATEPLGSNGLSFGPQDLVEAQGLLGPCRPSPSPLRSPKAPRSCQPDRGGRGWDEAQGFQGEEHCRNHKAASTSALHILESHFSPSTVSPWQIVKAFMAFCFKLNTCARREDEKSPTS